MESAGLKQFLGSVGDAVYAVNTICVGLTSVGSGDAKKPDELTISWSCEKPELAAKKARSFALRASLVFVEKALLEYLDFLKLCSLEDKQLVKALSTEGAADRVKEVSKCVSGLELYWYPMLILLIRWRNKVVHNSRIPLTRHQEKLLCDNLAVIKERHADIDIEKTLRNFAGNQITLKDFTTLIAVTVRYVRFLDEKIEPKIESIDGFASRLNQRALLRDFNTIMKTSSLEVRKRKFHNFIRTEFPELPEVFKDEIFTNGAID